MEEKFYLSKEKIEKMKKELEFSRTTRRSAITATLDAAKSLGDLSENAEYHNAREEQGRNESNIKRIEFILNNCIEVKDSGNDKVSIGKNVELSLEGKKIVYKIVSPEEMDLSVGKISYKSPLGSLLIDKKNGESVTVKTPKGEMIYTIEKIF